MKVFLIQSQNSPETSEELIKKKAIGFLAHVLCSHAFKLTLFCQQLNVLDQNYV